MSSPTGAVLDGLDPQLRAIQEKLFRNVPLTKAEEARWANRLAVEKETMRTGGQVKETAVPQTPATPKITPRQAGARDQMQAQDYIAGRDEAMRGGPKEKLAGTVPGQRAPRESMVMGDAPDAAKTFDNGVGPHRGQDGAPAKWNVPQGDPVGRYNGGNLNEGAGLPTGTIAMMGADGKYKQWQGGKFGDERYDSLAAVGQPKPPAAPAPAAPAAPSDPVANAAARAAMGPSSKAAGYPAGQPLPMKGVADMQPSQPPTADPQFLAQAWAGQGGGMTTRATPAAQPMPMISPPPPPATMDPGAGAWMGQGGQLQAGNVQPARRAPAPLISIPPEPVAAQRAPAPVIDISGANAVPQPEEKITGRSGGIVGRSSGPMFPNAIYNAGLVPQGATWTKPKPVQSSAAASAYNPFDNQDDEERRRRLAIMPE